MPHPMLPRFGRRALLPVLLRVPPAIVTAAGLLLSPAWWHPAWLVSAATGFLPVAWGECADVRPELFGSLPDAAGTSVTIRVIDPDPRLAYLARAGDATRGCLQWVEAFPPPPAALALPFHFELRSEAWADPVRVEMEVRVSGRTEPRWRANDPDPRAGGFHGRAMAIEGDLLFVGSGDSAAGTAEYLSVYRFDRESDTWTCDEQIGEPTDSDATGFGSVLALQNGIAAAGAPDAAGWAADGTPFRGKVFLLAPAEGSGSYDCIQHLEPPGLPAARTGFGEAVVFAHQPGHFLSLLVGEGGIGGVHVYDWDGGAGRFAFRQTLELPGAAAEGGRLSLASDGAIVAVGRALAEEPPRGLVRVFARDSATGAWEASGDFETGRLQAEMTGSFPLAVVENEVMVTALDEEEPDLQLGCVKRFVREGAGWRLAGMIETVENSWGTVDGYGRSLHAGGGHLFVGAERNEGVLREAVVYQFARVDEGWEEVRVLVAASEPGDAERVGPPAAVAAGADFVWIGAPGSGNAALAAAGVASGFLLEPDDDLAGSAYLEFERELAEAQPGLHAPLADADGDGIPNLLEFFLGTDPALPGPPRNGGLVLGADGALSFEFQQEPASAGLPFRVQLSADLTEWRDLAETLFEPGLEIERLWIRTVCLESERDPGKPLFVRLRVYLPDD